MLQPAGFENAQGILSAAYAKDGADPQWDNDEGMKKFYAFLAKYAPEANKADGSVVFGYGQAQTMVQVLKQAGDNLTRENIMKQAASLKDFTPDTLLPGVKINTSADRLLSDRAASDDAVQGREMGPVRTDIIGRSRRLGSCFTVFSREPVSNSPETLWRPTLVR